MTDSPELAGQKLIDLAPAGSELRTSVRRQGSQFYATAQIVPPDDVKPVYVGRGATEDEALLRAIFNCADYWHRREHLMGCNGR